MSFPPYHSQMGMKELPDSCQDIFLIITDMVLMELVLWKNTLHMIRMSTMHHCKWDCLHYMIQEEKILRIPKFGFIIF